MTELKTSYILRHPDIPSTDKLYISPYEDVRTLDQVFDRSLKLYANRPCVGRRFLKKVHRKEEIIDGMYELRHLKKSGTRRENDDNFPSI